MFFSQIFILCASKDDLKVQNGHIYIGEITLIFQEQLEVQVG